jgi:predicted nucleic acid-binding Zn ribbon protein
MSRLNPIEKACSECGKRFFAKRSDAIYCSNLCRAVVSNREKVGAAVAEAKAEIIESVEKVVQENKGNFNFRGTPCVCCAKPIDNDDKVRCNTCFEIPVEITWEDRKRITASHASMFVQRPK